MMTLEKQNDRRGGFGSGQWLDPATNDKKQYVQTIRHTENERQRIRKREGATVQNGSGC